MLVVIMNTTLCGAVSYFIYQLFNSKIYNKVAVIPTILISGVYHEYVLWAPVRFVMPVLLVQFGTFGGKVILSSISNALIIFNIMSSFIVFPQAIFSKYWLELFSSLLIAPWYVNHALLLHCGVLC